VRSRAASLAGSALFLIVAPGTVAGLVPWLISRWQEGADFGESSLPFAVGALLLAGGMFCLVESFVRFAWIGLGTPAPVARTRRLIVSGPYRYVRNPMYLAVLAVICGQALILGRAELIVYAVAIWLLFHLFVTLHEEPSLRRRFPTDYAAYVEAVPRWVPSIRGWNSRNP
jgi:protein-S-isoprenylcysteine O-methyltransferase Ste14